MERLLKYRITLAATGLLMAPLGYIVRFSKGTFPDWFTNGFGNFAYESLWILLGLALWPRVRPRTMAIGVCLATCLIEFQQALQYPPLVALRATLPGRLVLGNTFSWDDFPTYFLGSALGYALAGAIQRWTLGPRQLGH
jgi:Protein of unknown function (DUF2809)